LIQNNIGDTGGGLTVGGPTTITNTEFRNNIGDGGAFWATATATLEMTGGIIAQNVSLNGFAGGIANFGIMTLTDVAIVDNNGFAIWNDGSALLNRVTLEANRGYAVVNIDPGDIVVRNSTFVDNLGVAYNLGILIFENATLWNNNELPNRGAINNGIGAYLTFRNTIMGEDVGSHCEGTPAVSSNFSLFEDVSCNWQSGSANIVDPDLAMGPLGPHGGLTWTMLPPANSLAIDAGQCNLPEDQRGVSRPQGVACDIGSVERKPGDGGYLVYLPLVVR
jgi:hypothetical protein